MKLKDGQNDHDEKLGARNKEKKYSRPWRAKFDVLGEVLTQNLGLSTYVVYSRYESMCIPIFMKTTRNVHFS